MVQLVYKFRPRIDPNRSKARGIHIICYSEQIRFWFNWCTNFVLELIQIEARQGGFTSFGIQSKFIAPHLFD